MEAAPGNVPSMTSLVPNPLIHTFFYAVIDLDTGGRSTWPGYMIV